MSTTPDRIRVLFLIRSLGLGGAERQLCLLVRNLDHARFDIVVAPMYAGGELEQELRGVPGVVLAPLGKTGRWDVLGFGRRLLKLARSFRPHIVHPYMGGANEIGALLAGLVPSRLVWGIRVSDLDFSRYRRSVGSVFALGRLLSGRPDLIIFNSYRGREVHLAAGYDSSRTLVIPNGIETDRFVPSPERGLAWRRRHGFAPDTLVIGYPARLDPMKDHPCFLRAAASYRDRFAGDRATAFVALGDGAPDYRARLMALTAELGLGGLVHWLPMAPDPVDAYNGCDIVTSTSAFGEGFPNVLGEALSCGRPCAATDVGDAARIVGPVGIVVAPGDADRLASGWHRLSSPEYSPGPAERRGHIIAEYSVDRLVERTDRALATVASGQVEELVAAGSVRPIPSP